MDEKITRDILVDPPVSFGDTVAAPLECHVLLEGPHR